MNLNYNVYMNSLLFADILIVADSVYDLYYLRFIISNYVTKQIVAFYGKRSVHMELIVANDILEMVSHFKFLCMVTVTTLPVVL